MTDYERGYLQGKEDATKKITELLMYLHNKASAFHNYYQHAAVEINRNLNEGKLI